MSEIGSMGEGSLAEIRLTKEEADAMAALIDACACTTLRKASRVVTSHFDQAFGGTGLKSTQISVMLAVAVHGPTTIRRLADAAVMDPSSLSRALPRLEQLGYIKKSIGQSRRSREVEITEEGLSLIAGIMPIWKSAQNKLLEVIGPGNHSTFLDLLHRVILASDQPDDREYGQNTNASITVAC